LTKRKQGNRKMNEKIRRLWPSALVPLIFIVCTIIQFWPALTGAANLSKVQLLAEWDSLFAAQSSGHSMLMDPSLVYLMIPSYLLKALLIHSGQLPLWNPYSGLGCPLAADPQSLAFSPLHLPLIFSPGLVAYNQVLVIEILILGLSTFALARSLKLGLFASAFAMVAMAFCPYERWYLELLGNGYCFVPLVFCLILGLRSNVTAAKVWLTAFGCAIMVLSAHPELSFFSIGLASVALLLYVIFDRAEFAEDAKIQSESATYKGRLRNACIGLAAAGALTFMLAGPMLLPFLEYLRNSDSYKFGSGAPAVMPWQTWVFNMLQPGYAGASPTLGPCALLLIPLAFCAPRSNKTLVRVFAGLAAFCIPLTGKMFPLNLILSHPPFSYLVVTYAFPSLIVMTAILAAFGLHTILSPATASDASRARNNETPSAVAPESPSAIAAESPSAPATETSGAPAPKTLATSTQIGFWPLSLSLALALSVAAFPMAVKALHLPLGTANFDMCMPDYALNRNDVVRYAVIALLTGAAVLAVKLKPVRKTALFLMTAICLGQSAEIITAAKSIPKREPFKYQDQAVVPTLKTLTSNGTERFIATGNHLFRPNTNVVFGLSDLRTHNPLFPKRYLAYLKACGAHLDEFNQEFESPLSPLLALASVRAVLSQSPVISEKELASNTASAYKPLTVEPEPGIKATFTPVILDKQKRAIFGSLDLAAGADRAAALNYNLALYDAAGQVLWFSDARPMAGDLKASKFIAIPTPAAEGGKSFLLGLQVYDNKAGHWLSPKPAGSENTKLKHVFVLGSIDFEKAINTSSPDYKLVFENTTRLQIFENIRALPRAYAVHKTLYVTSAEESLEAIRAASFDPRQTVVIETPATPGGAAAHGNGASSLSSATQKTADTVNIVELKADKIIVEAEMQQSGIVVLNDMYYPGWQATIDEKPTPILRADYLMRAVDVGTGKHRIVFNYLPATFVLGLILSIIALLGGVVIALRVRKR
jgi:hypothetical protein